MRMDGVNCIEHNNLKREREKCLLQNSDVFICKLIRNSCIFVNLNNKTKARKKNQIVYK